MGGDRGVGFQALRLPFKRGHKHLYLNEFPAEAAAPEW